MSDKNSAALKITKPENIEIRSTVRPKAGDEIVTTLSLDQLVRNPAQPDQRMTKTRIRSLIENLRLRGQRTPIIVQEIKKDSYVILDGHCRVEAAKILGWSDIRAYISTSDLDPVLAWADVNTARKLTGGQLFTSWCQVNGKQREAFLSVLRPHERANIMGMVKVFGGERAEELASKGINPGIQRIALTLYKTMSELVDPKLVPGPKEVGEWVVSHKGAQGDMSHAFPKVAGRNKRAWTRLARAIKTDTDFPRGSW